MSVIHRPLFVGLALLALGACSDSSDSGSASPLQPGPEAIYSVANSCVYISPAGSATYLQTPLAQGDAGGSSALVDNIAAADRVLLRPSDLGKYLLYNQQNNYIASADGQFLQARPALDSDTRLVGDEVLIEDRMQSEGEWLLDVGGGGFTLQHIRSGAYLAADGTLSAEAAALEFIEAQGCAQFPELSVDASGDVAFTEFDDGDVFGFVETHAHLFTNRAFGGGGAFHGAPFHPLGVEHALPSCELTHGAGGRRDFIGFAFNDGLGDFSELLPLLATGELSEDDHVTDGYPDFTEWPSAPFSATHQMQYYTWIERAYKAGLRLMVQHVTTNQVLCELVVGIGTQPLRESCNDMVTADRIIEDTYALERYIDAQMGGPGNGWFRVVNSPEAAREEIRAGNMAVVLGIEVSDLFDCFLVPFGGFERCSEADVVARLDEYYDKGVRVLFPVHKLDNDFSAGDGDRRISDISNFGHTGHFSNFDLCPEEFLTFPGGFDRGGVNFANLNMPRAIYDSEPPFDMTGFAENPIGALLPNLGLLGGGRLEGEYCQNHGLTSLGEFLISEMMKRGMVIEVDHLPRRAYKRTFEILAENDYPAAGTHGRNFNGVLYELGGISKSNLGRCRDPETPATMDDRFQERVQLIRDSGGYAAEGFGFDLNGFAGAPGPRFGERSGCSQPQTDAGITYPFTSFAGDITLEAPRVGNRTLDFNTEGMVHLGLVAELIEDVRRDGVTDEELEPLFRSAEGYLRMWEKSERRGREISGG
ncbi:MAG: hypothetical protein Hals2KO_31620 [Halioglobus sp.]